MSKNKTGLISKDFPLYHSDLIPTYSEPNHHNRSHTIAKNRILYTNEHPEIFRLEGMKEGGYYNPYISEAIKVDRSEYLKKLSSDRKNVNFIDFIKSNRKYSQDPNVIRYITVDANKELRNKRMGNKKNDLILSQDNINSNISEYEGNRYLNLVRKLNHFVPKIDYRIKNTLDMDNINNIDQGKRCNTYGNISNNELIEQMAKEEKINNKPINFKNYSNFKINEVDDDNKNINEFKFNRKPVQFYNPIKDRIETINPPPFKNKKWSLFLENYFLLANSGKKFRRRGGLFTEFCNKNINSINVDKFRIQQELKKKREEKEKSKEKK
jgi:hypothetical protein